MIAAGPESALTAASRALPPFQAIARIGDQRRAASLTTARQGTVVQAREQTRTARRPRCARAAISRRRRGDRRQQGPVRLVSSAAITATSRRTCAARADRSSRVPIGVATRTACPHSCPASRRPLRARRLMSAGSLPDPPELPCDQGAPTVDVARQYDARRDARRCSGTGSPVRDRRRCPRPRRRRRCADRRRDPAAPRSRPRRRTAAPAPRRRAPRRRRGSAKTPRRRSSTGPERAGPLRMATRGTLAPHPPAGAPRARRGDAPARRRAAGDRARRPPVSSLPDRRLRVVPCSCARRSTRPSSATGRCRGARHGSGRPAATSAERSAGEPPTRLRAADGARPRGLHPAGSARAPGDQPTLAGWLELADIATGLYPTLEAQQNDVERWRRRWEIHPAADALPERLARGCRGSWPSARRHIALLLPTIGAAGVRGQGRARRPSCCAARSRRRAAPSTTC